MKKILFFILAMSLSFGLFFCRNDSSQKLIQEHLLRTLKLSDSLKILDSLVNYYKVRDNKRAHYYAHRAMALALGISSPEALVKGHLLMGIVCRHDKNDSAFYFYNIAWNLAVMYKVVSLKSIVMYNIADLYIEAKNKEMGIQLLDSVIKLASEANNFKMMSNAYNSLGNIRIDINEP